MQRHPGIAVHVDINAVLGSEIDCQVVLAVAVKIRLRQALAGHTVQLYPVAVVAINPQTVGPVVDDKVVLSCLLYTSDAADERSSVDLGGRRIIKKKNNRRRRV